MGAVVLSQSELAKFGTRFRSDAGLKCWIVRTTDGKCCSWCTSIAGRYEYGKEPQSVYRRHDNCGCTVTYENGRQRQDVWSKRTWESDQPTPVRVEPTRLTGAQGREIEQRNLSQITRFSHVQGEAVQAQNLRYRGLEAEVSKLKTKNSNTLINSAFIESSEYRRRFDQLGESTQMTRIISQRSREMLVHRNGTEFEDLVFIDSITGKVRSRTDYNVPRMVEPSKAMHKMLSDAEPHTIIAIHNHPSSTVPSISDINAARDRKYKYGIIACHDGKLFKYSVIDEYDENFVDSALDNINSILYNKDNLGEKFPDRLKNALGSLRRLGIDMEVVL